MSWCQHADELRRDRRWHPTTREDEYSFAFADYEFEIRIQYESRNDQWCMLVRHDRGCRGYLLDMSGVNEADPFKPSFYDVFDLGGTRRCGVIAYSVAEAHAKASAMLHTGYHKIVRRPRRKA